MPTVRDVRQGIPTQGGDLSDEGDEHNDVAETSAEEGGQHSDEERDQVDGGRNSTHGAEHALQLCTGANEYPRAEDGKDVAHCKRSGKLVGHEDDHGQERE